MTEDSVMQEVRAARDAYARSLGYDLRAMVADLRERDDRGDWPVVRLDARRPSVAKPASSEPNVAPERTSPVATVPGQIELSAESS